MVLLKTYKGHKIERTKNGIIEVVDKKGTRFVVALDDSKKTGKRRFINSANNITTAKKYIDFITGSRK